MRDQALIELSADAAGAGDAEIARNALRTMNNLSRKDEAAQESIRRLIKHGQRKPALEIAREISDLTARDRALAELAQ
jgi:hypothetical protein